MLPLLSRVEGQSYADLFQSLIEIVHHAFGYKQTEWWGFKQTWTEAFVAPLFNTWPTARCVHIVRDPRAIIASWKRSIDLTHDCPFLMMILHWRKSVAQADLYSRKFENYKLVRYEDFVQSPQEEMEGICKLCGIEFDENALNANSFRNGSGKRWNSNTSYGKRGEAQIFTQYTCSWKDRLTEEELQLIEDLCGLEMQLIGYERETEYSQPSSIMKPVNIERQTHGESEWIDQFAGEYVFNSENQAKELCRWFLVHHGKDYARKLPLDALRKIFINPAVITDWPSALVKKAANSGK